MSFPTSLDSLTDPAATDKRNNPSLAEGQTLQNAAIEAVEAKVGVDSSAVTTSHDYKLSGVTGTDKAVSKTGTETLTNKTLTAPTITSPTTTGTDSGVETLANKTLTSPLINSPTLDNARVTDQFNLDNWPLVIDDDSDTYIVALADDQINFYLGGTERFRMTTSTFSARGNQIATDTISEYNTAAGVTIDGVLLKDNQIKTDNAVPGNSLATDAITLGYAEITSNFTTSSTSQVQVTGLTSTVTIPAGGRKVKITAFTGYLFNTTSGNSAFFRIWDGVVGSGTQLAGARSYAINNSTGNSVTLQAIVTPSAGSKTYNVSAFVDPAGTATVEAAATMPAFILVELI